MVYENVEALTGTIVDQTTSIFDQLRSIAQGAIGAALSPVNASLGSANLGIDEPEGPTEEPSLSQATEMIDKLKDALLNRPSYPTYAYNSPELPTLDTNPPAMTDVTLPEAPSLQIPSFTAILEGTDVDMPTARWEFSETLYSSPLYDALYNVLLDAVENGDYGINPLDEQRISSPPRGTPCPRVPPPR
jgi:hypothetical protein